MNYEKIIVELLGRIQALEEKVEALEKGRNEKGEELMSTEDIRRYIKELKRIAMEEGKVSLVLIARDIHGDLNLKSRYPMVCNAMRQCMEENDVILFQPPKGNSSTLEIKYML